MAYFYELKATSLAGEEVDLSRYQGKVVLVVNTASKCGLTPQYEGLEKLYQQYHEQGLEILGFPCNQFGGQEPGDESSIEQTCYVNYGVSFPMFSKVEVNGTNSHPLFSYLRKAKPGLLGGDIRWNFTKFLINQNGEPVERFAPITKPEKIAKKVAALLANNRKPNE